MKRLFYVAGVGLGLGVCVLAGIWRFSQSPSVAGSAAPTRGFAKGRQRGRWRWRRMPPTSYSYRGLPTYADALDMSGETRRAERLYRDAAERYNPVGRDGALLAFLQRHRTDSAAYAGEARELAAKVFPKGQTRSRRNRCPAPPTGVCAYPPAAFSGNRTGFTTRT